MQILLKIRDYLSVNANQKQEIKSLKSEIFALKEQLTDAQMLSVTYENRLDSYVQQQHARKDADTKIAECFRELIRSLK